MVENFPQVVVAAIILSLALTVITDFGLTYVIMRKVRRNHFKTRIWHAILFFLGLVFAIDGVLSSVELCHMIVHSYRHDPAHWLVAGSYVPKMVVNAVFAWILYLYSGAFDMETKIGV